MIILILQERDKNSRCRGDEEENGEKRGTWTEIKIMGLLVSDSLNYVLKENIVVD